MNVKIIIGILIVLSLTGCVRYYNGFGKILTDEELFVIDDTGNVKMFFYDLKESVTEKDYLFYLPQEGTNEYYGSFYFFNENKFNLNLRINDLTFSNPDGTWKTQVAAESDSLIFLLKANTGYPIPEHKQVFYDFDVNIPEEVTNVNMTLEYNIDLDGTRKFYTKEFAIEIGSTATILPWKGEKQ